VETVDRMDPRGVSLAPRPHRIIGIATFPLRAAPRGFPFPAAEPGGVRPPSNRFASAAVLIP